MKFYDYLVKNSDSIMYCDMDGVLVDFISGANKVAKDNNFSEEWVELANKSQDFAWKIINELGSDFWMNLDWEKDGKKLWNKIKKYNPIILSAYPYSIEDPTVKTDAIIGKKDWIAKNIGDNDASKAIICSRDEKAMFAESNAILIDDMEKNIKEWQEAGGVGVLHKSYGSTLNKLQELL